MKLRLPDKKVFQVPLKKVSKGGRNFWIGSLSLDAKNNKDFSIVKSALNEKLFIYDEKGLLVKESELGSLFKLNEQIDVQFIEFITSTGLQIKSDPGISTVYFSFFLLMVSIYISFFTYSQIWLIEDRSLVTVGGKSNRSVLFFQEEFRKILKRTSVI